MNGQANDTTPRRQSRLMVVRVIARPDGRLLRFYDWEEPAVDASPTPRHDTARPAAARARS